MLLEESKLHMKELGHCYGLPLCKWPFDDDSLGTVFQSWDVIDSREMLRIVDCDFQRELNWTYSHIGIKRLIECSILPRTSSIRAILSNNLIIKEL